MDQLLNDKSIHPAAPIVLAGAALEELLRSLWYEVGSLTLKGKPSINAYATALQAANVLNRQDVKQITAWAGLRNDAAHGNFAALDLAQANVMVAGVNLFMQQHSPTG